MSHTEQDNEPVPWMQQLLDNPFLLLFLGVMIPMVVYILWVSSTSSRSRWPSDGSVCQIIPRRRKKR